MTSRIDWVRGSCRLLLGIAEEFAATLPFSGLTIGTGIHLEPKTVALLLTLTAGGARVVSTGNLNSTQPDAVEYLRGNGVDVIGDRTMDEHEHDEYLREVLRRQPHLLLDNGGDLFARYLDEPYERLLGGTEETTSVGRGIAASFRNAFASVAVVEPDPVLRLEASFDGFQVPDRAAGLRHADVVITATCAQDVITEADLVILRHRVVLINAGHFPAEIAVDRIMADPRVTGRRDGPEGITTLRLTDGREIHVLTEGHMVNLGGPRPLGNSIESMDLGFALQARCLEAVALGRTSPDDVVIPVPAWINALVAEAFLEQYLG